MTGVILAAGNGSRLKASRKENVCKPLMHINGLPLIAYSLENCLRLKLDRAVVVVGREGELIRRAVGNSYKGLSVEYVSQPEPRGLVHGLMQALKILEQEEDVLLQLSDEIFADLKTEAILDSICGGEYGFLCGVVPEEDPEKIKRNYSVELGSSGVLLNCTEKPAAVSEPVKGTGLCWFGRQSLALLRAHYSEERNSPADLCDYMNLLVREGFRGIALQAAEREFNINTAADLAEAEQM